VADLIATVTEIATVAVAGEAEIPAKAAASRLRIIAIVPGSHANPAGNTHQAR
jgi:hypothetical protein